MFFLLVIFCFATVPVTNGEKIHGRMTAKEVEQIFQTSHDSVPDYEIVQFRVSRLVKRGSRSARALRVTAFGENLKLWLRPAEGILAGEETPVFISKKNSNGNVAYDVYPNAMKNVGKLLEDPKMKASLIISRNSRGLHSIDGHIASKNLVVRSLPSSITDNLINNSSSRYSRSLINSKSTQSAYHVVFKREVKIVEKKRMTVETNIRTTRAAGSTNVIPDVVYPEIMVVVDSTYMELNDNNIDKVLAYVVTFWNGVDLLYRSFEGPKFRFNIARVIIAKDKYATPYISENMVDSTIYNAYEALGYAEMHYFDLLDKFPANSYDAVVTMSRLDMGYGGVDPDILGIMSKRGGACQVDYKKKIMMNVALITDTGSFDGVSTAAHEFAHLLGANHDEWITCLPKSGYIMTSASGITDNSHDFSECTVEDIQEYLNNDGGTCLYNVPSVRKPLPRVLPGQLRDRDYQCKIFGRGKSCYNESKKHLPCTAIYCEDPKKSGSCFESKENAPSDGAFCSKGKVCLHGKCVSV